MASLNVARNVALRVAGASARREFSSLITVAEEFPGLPATSPSPSKASSPSVTALANGLTIVSEDASTTTTISLTFPKAGSGDEAVGESGAALINKELSFKSGSGLSAAVLLRHLEDEGAVPFSTAGRNGATVGFTAAPDKAIPLIPLLATECSFEKWEVRDAKKLAATETAEANKNAQVVLTESVFAAAYGAQSAMGRPFFSADASAPAIQSFRERAYGLNGAVLSATGITDHAAFVAAVKDGLEDAPAGSASPAATATFVGGESRIAAPSMGFAHVALGFEGPTGPIATVIKHCLKLMGTSGFASPGLIGVYGSAPSAGAADILDSLSTAVTSKVSADTVQRAKGLAKAEALFALDGGSQALASAMAAGVLETGTFSTAEVAGSYDSITETQVNAAMSIMLKSNPAVAAIGDIVTVPYQAMVASRFS